MTAARLLLVALAVTAAAAGCGARPARVVARRSERLSSARCEPAARSRKDYGWPLKPFDVQHPIRGGFGDPRTIADASFGNDAVGTEGDYSFHNGIDIYARVGTPVYPVVSGVAHVVGLDEVNVRAGLRSFRYQHIRSKVHNRQRVIAGVTVLGTVLFPFRHVHFTEIDRERVVNPLTHLRPYTDHTAPFVHWAAIGQHMGEVTMTADVSDLPPLRVPGAWGGHPLAPAFVRASLTSPTGRVVWHQTAADFRKTEPTDRHFWDVYAAGTYQNFPVFDHHYYWGMPGNYVFVLSHGTRLPDGRYTLHVVAQDLCGNVGTLNEPVTIGNDAS
jgi:hypothetical protein